MANPEHLRILKQGVEAWNKWREENPYVGPDLIGAYLSGEDLRGADLGGANLRGVDLSGTNLSGANLYGADLFSTDLSNANISQAMLWFANLTNASLDGTNLSEVGLGSTTFADNDLSTVAGLDSVKHVGPSYITIDTIYISKGKIPESFLRGAGVPENFIEYMHSLTGNAFEYYSCFISYSSKDQEFKDRLSQDLRINRVQSWSAPEDMKIGDRMRDSVDESIRRHDKMLLILSETSVTSQWVEQEVETALDEERKRGKTVVFPVRLDDAVLSVDKGWPNYIKNSRHIGDFTDWKNHDSYQKAFDRLLRDLKAG